MANDHCLEAMVGGVAANVTWCVRAGGGVGRTMHLGLIGGIGPAATEFYYRGLVKAYASLDETLELTIVHASTRVLLDNMAKGAATEQAEIFRSFVERLARSGADIAVVTSLSGHFCIRELEEISPLPTLNALPALDRHFERQGIGRVGLLGTRTVVQSKLYGGHCLGGHRVAAGHRLRHGARHLYRHRDGGLRDGRTARGAREYRREALPGARSGCGRARRHRPFSRVRRCRLRLQSGRLRARPHR